MTCKADTLCCRIQPVANFRYGSHALTGNQAAEDNRQGVPTRAVILFETGGVRLQEANDARDSTALADFLTPDVLAEVQQQWQAEAAAQGKTEVVTLESEVLDVVTEGLLYIVSVQFSGLIREGAAAEAQPFAEIWHLEKPLRGATGWLVSGIQQA